jgi:hypothetical protein
VLRYDHVELPNGRVQVQLDLRMPHDRAHDEA